MLKEECFICKQIIKKEDMDNNEIEMIMGPQNKKVFVHRYHKGVCKELNEEYKE